ncbi:MAG: single-stranded DNA-binding protein [Chloroflexaceae bacterium]
MAKDLNKVQVTGRLGANPEMRYTAQGSAVTNFRVASNRTWKDRDGNQHEDTEWFRVVAWDKLGEICNEYLTRGTHVYVEGRLQTRKWTDSDGNDRYTTEVVAQDMIILSSKNGARGQDAGSYNQDEGNSYQDEEEPVPQQSRAPAAPARRPAPANQPARRNQPQPIENDDDIPF